MGAVGGFWPNSSLQRLDRRYRRRRRHVPVGKPLKITFRTAIANSRVDSPRVLEQGRRYGSLSNANDLLLNRGVAA